MTDLPGLPAPSSTPISNPQIASARASWIAAGLSAERFDQGMAEAPATNAAPAVQAPSGPSGPTGGGVSRSEALAMSQSLLASGVDPQRVADALRGEGYDDLIADLGTGATPSELDQAFGQVKDARSINIDWRGLGFGPETDTATLAELQTHATRWGQATGLPASVASSVIETAISSAHALAKMSPAAKAEWVRSEQAAFARMVGVENVPAALKSAALALSRSNGAFQDQLMASGALSSAAVVAQLSVQGSRLASMMAS